MKHHTVCPAGWLLQVTPCLFINKLDRLIQELRMSPAEVLTTAAASSLPRCMLTALGAEPCYRPMLAASPS
jgi:translation elongation factor EF-G